MNELARLHALNLYAQMLSFPQRELDEITELASIICETPISLITFIDEENQWFKSKVGLTTEGTPRDQAFCHFAIQTPNQVMVVPDAHQDVRFIQNPLVTGDLNIRFYAGAPLVTAEGYALGSLCVIDHTPRALSTSQKRSLELLSTRIIQVLDDRRRQEESLRLFKSSNERLFTLANQAPIFLFTMNSSLEVTYVNQAIADLRCSAIIDAQGCTWVHPDHREAFTQQCKKALEEEKPVSLDVKIVESLSTIEWVSCQIVPIRAENGPFLDLMVIGVDITNRVHAQESMQEQLHSLQRMLHMVSHEMRSPITKIQGLVTLLNNPEISAEDKQKCLDYLKSSAAELDQYTRDLTNVLYEDFSKVHASDTNALSL